MFEIGDKIICIKSRAGNEGKIGEVVGYFDGGLFEPTKNTFSNCDIIVRSLGSGLSFKSLNDGTIIRGMIEIPDISPWWRKLPELTEDETQELTEEIK